MISVDFIFLHFNKIHVQGPNGLCDVEGVKPRLHVQVVVMLRFDQCRKDQVELRVYFPRKKARHVKCNYQDLVRRSEEDYVDFRQAWAGG